MFVYFSQWDQFEEFDKLITNNITNNNQTITNKQNYEINSEDLFQLNIGRALMYLNQAKSTEFYDCIWNYRKQTISSLTAATRESYTRSYPMLIKLHALYDLEMAYKFIHNNNDNNSNNIESNNNIVEMNHWNERINMMSNSMRQRSPILAIHRTILESKLIINQTNNNNNQNNNLANNSLTNNNLYNYWLNLSNNYKNINQFDLSMLALRHAELYAMNNNTNNTINTLNNSNELHENIKLYECKILKQFHYNNKALNIIEPIDININNILESLNTTKKMNVKLPNYLNTKEKRYQLAEKLYLATQILIENNQKYGKVILLRFKCILELKDNNWDQGHFDLAKYYEMMYQSNVNDELILQKQQPLIVQATTATGRPSSSSSNLSNNHTTHSIDNSLSKTKYRLLLHSLDHYSRCIATSTSYVMQALPRMTTLWLAFTLRNNLANLPNVARTDQEELNKSMKEVIVKRIPYMVFMYATISLSYWT